MTKNSELNNYLQSLTKDQQKEYSRISRIVKEQVPEVEEGMSYAIPTFKYKNKNLLHFGGFKNHMSLFPSPGPITDLGAKLEKYSTGKGTLSYKLEEPFPEELLVKLIQARLKQIS